MALIAQYKHDQEVTGTTNVSAWGNIAGAGLDLATGAGFDDATQVVVNPGTGDIAMIQGKDTATGTKLETASNAGVLSEGTVVIVGRQQAGTFQNDLNGNWIQGPEFSISRGSGATVQAKFGANTPTFINRSLANGTVAIIIFRFNATTQKLRINNGADATSSDVSAIGLNSKLEINYQGLKSYAEIRVYDNELSDGDVTTLYDTLNTEYITAPVTTVLNFPSLPTKAVGDADFAPGATSNSPAAITYTSSNPAVATIVSGNIHIVGAGTSTITASQGAHAGYTDPADVQRTLTVTSNSNTMADVVNSVYGGNLTLYISTNMVTPAYKAVVCSTGRIGVDGTDEGGTSVVTRCGVARAAGRSGYEVPFEGIFNSSISSGSEMSGDEIFLLNESKAQFLWKIEADNPADYYRAGAGTITAYSDGGEADGFVSFSGTITVNGAVDITP